MQSQKDLVSEPLSAESRLEVGDYFEQDEEIATIETDKVWYKVNEYNKLQADVTIVLDRRRCQRS